MKTPLLRMQNITKSFPGITALKNVNIDVFKGETLALLGANGAGKSTLMNILGGVLHPDHGDIFINNQKVRIVNPTDASNYNIAFVHQEMALFPTMTIAENMFIARYPTKGILVDNELINRECNKVFLKLGCKFNPNSKIRDNSIGDRQIVEIARALLWDPQIIIFDEPTSSLTEKEKERLFGVIGSLRREGVAVIYITHFLDEVFEVCDRAIILRNGEVVGEGLIRELSYEEIVRKMIGNQTIDEYFGSVSSPASTDIILSVKDVYREGVLYNIDFDMYKGEILGLWGLLGSGRTELARCLAGLDTIDKGKIFYKVGKELKEISQNERKKYLGMITEDRLGEGLLLPMSIKSNISLANLRNLMSFWPIVSSKLEADVTKTHVDQLNIISVSVEQKVETLSGGNQQKVIVSRWLQRKPAIYIMDEPTKGLDVGAKAEIRKIISDLVGSGASVLLISSEIDEIIALSNRFIVMDRGRIITKLSGDVSKDDLIKASVSGYRK